jgi:hypothetical protein
MKQEQPTYDELLLQQQAKAKAAILAECDNLAAAGVTFVAAHFDGAGDEGITEDVKCYNADEYVYEQGEHLALDTSHLQEHFDAVVPYGYEIGSGGFGDVILDVRRRKIIVERNDRFEDYSTSTYEV